MTIDSGEFLYLNEQEFKELNEKSKWNYITGLMKQLKDSKIMAENNCDECIYRIQTNTDVNIDMFFEDWRLCANECDSCNIQQLKEMCQTQFELISHLANSLVELQMKQNMLVKFIYRKDDSGKKLLEMLVKEKNKPKSDEDYFR